jgi:uncharacterized membrane protein
MTKTFPLKLTLIAVITALNVAVSMILHVPVPGTNGYVNLIDAGIFIAALLFGRVIGGWVGALSGALLDLVLGYPQWIIFSIIAHGLQGYLVGMVRAKGFVNELIMMLIGATWMVFGYFIGGAILTGWAASAASVPANIMQGLAGLLVTVAMLPVLKQVKIVQRLQKAD